MRLGVADDGPGHRARGPDKLFVPHFSTKKRGSGLGLAIVSRIVQEHQGAIRVEDNRPAGRALRGRAAGVSVRRSDMRESILSSTTRRACAARSRASWATRATRSRRWRAARPALAALESRRYDLLLLDVWLPGHGRPGDAARAIRTLDPDLPVVVISGHGNIETAVKAVRMGAQDFVEKPLSLEKTLLVGARTRCASAGWRRRTAPSRSRSSTAA